MRPADPIAARRRGLTLALLLLEVGCSDHSVAPGPSARLVLRAEVNALSAGDIVLVDVVAVDERGNPVSVGPVTLTTDDPAVAVVDGSARLRAVSVGKTTLRGDADGVVGHAEVDVLAASALLELGLLGGEPLPVLIAADTVEWNGESEYHEVFAASGALSLTGGAQPRYELTVRYEEYDVRLVEGRRSATLRLEWSEYDRGLVAYDASGDLGMTSELIAPLHHRSEPVGGGFIVDFRIPGSDERLELFYRR